MSAARQAPAWAAGMGHIVDLQIEYSLASRAPEAKLFRTLDELGISATSYGVLSRGLLAGSKPKGRWRLRAYLPRFAASHRSENTGVIERLQQFAAQRGMSAGQLASAWARANAPRHVGLRIDSPAGRRGPRQG